MFNFLQQLSLTKQLRFSFTLMIVLLVIVSIVGYFGMNSTSSGFTSYRSLVLETNLSGRMQANLLYMRLAVVKYIKEDSDETLQQYQERHDKLTSFFNDAKKLVTDSSRRSKLEESKRLVQEYDTNFKEVQRLIAQRHQVVNDELNPTGKKARELFTELLDDLHYKGNSEQIYSVAKLAEALLLGRLYVVKYLVTNSESDKEMALNELQETLQLELSKTLRANASLSSELGVIADKLNAYVSAFEKVTVIITARNKIIEGKLNYIGAKVASNLEEMKLGVKNQQDIIGPEVKNTSAFLLQLVTIISTIAVLLGLVLTFTLPNVIRRPIGGEPKEIAGIARKIASGDFTQQFHSSEDATGIYASMATMSKDLSTTIAGVVGTGSQLTERANYSADMASQTQDIVLNQKDRTSQIATAINEMAYSIQEVVTLSSRSAESANDAKSTAENGLTLIEQMVSAIERLSGIIENAMQDIRSLEQSSQNIGAVVEVIGNISEQTNLLALNAAIEAARAGEQGRGFAVVADEVRNLAKRTQDSTNEIQVMIESIQTGTDKAVSSMDESTQEAVKTVELSSETKMALEEILHRISTINDMNGQVAVAINEQSTVCENVNQNITFITESAEQSESSAMGSAQASQDLKELSQQLGEIVSKFKV